MTFKIKPTGAPFTWPVKVLVPGEGRHDVQQFKATFKTVDRDRIIALTPGDAEADQALLEEVFIGCEGVADEEGNLTPYSPALRDMLLGIPYVRTAITTAFFEGIGGRKAKN